MFNIGFTEFLAIGVIALIVIGPKQLPEVARVVGRLISELKKATQDLSGGLLEVTKEVKSTIDETKEEIINEGRKVVESVTNLDAAEGGNKGELGSSSTSEQAEPQDTDKTHGK